VPPWPREEHLKDLAREIPVGFSLQDPRCEGDSCRLEIVGDATDESAAALQGFLGRVSDELALPAMSLEPLDGKLVVLLAGESGPAPEVAHGVE
jgi:hypothetical protein